MVTTQDVLAVVARSPQNWGAGRRQWLQDEVDRLGASDEDLVSAAVVGMDSDDRNMRVRAVWILSLSPDPRATAAVLRALRDPVRRVREVALKSVRPHHVASPDVWRAVQDIADDDHETNRLRQHAFFVLSSSAVRDTVPDVAEDTLRSLMDSDRFRGSLLFQLCSATGHPPAARAILLEFVRSGSKDEAVMATRALCGHRLVRVDAWLPAELRQRVRDTYDAAPDVYGGVPLAWVPAADAEGLAREVAALRTT
jgi:hypothetical protein